MRHTATANVPDSFGSDEAVFKRLDEILAVCKRLVETLGGDDVRVRRVWLTPKEAASYLRLHPVTLAKLRSKGAGPRFYSRGRLVRYHVQDIDSYLRGDACQQEAADAER